MEKAIRSVGIVLRPDSPSFQASFLNLKNIFQTHDINVFIEENSADMIGLNNIDYKKSFEFLAINTDLLISLGGDGSLLSLARKSLSYDVACMGINMGRLGFLTNILPHELEEFAKDLKYGRYDIHEHMVLKAQLEHNKNANLIALNEFLISRNNTKGMANITAKIGGKEFNTYHCDGLLISTPTGSTAYNISAGGPVVYPYCRNIILNPLAPHSLTQRPLVLNDEFVLEFTSSNDTILLIDGQDTYNIPQNSTIQISSHTQGVRLVYARGHNYFSILKQKFNWGENP